MAGITSYFLGFSVNAIFYKNSDDNLDPTDAEDGAKRILYNIEVAPPENNDKESLLNIHKVLPGSVFTHCNR